MKRTIYINGKVVTVDDARPEAEAVVVTDGILTYVGDNAAAQGFADEGTEVVDLGGKAMLPGFIDPHSHFLMAASVADFTTLSAPPIADIESIEDVIAALKTDIAAKGIPAGELVLGWGYDESLLAEGRVPTNKDLDRVSQEHPIFILHQSGHKGVGNSALLAAFNITEASEDPEGGHIGRYPGTKVPNGTLEEKASMAIIMKKMAAPTPEQFVKNLAAGGELYASHGITTAQDGGMQKPSVPAAEMAGKNGLLKIDVVGYYLIQSMKDFEDLDNFTLGSYSNHFKLGGAKILLDGSPQAKTAWLSKPYHIPPPGEDASYRGYPFYERDEFVISLYEECLKREIQVLTHTNGDQASEQLITCLEKAREKTGFSADIRPVMIHAQTVRDDQLDRMVPLHMIPSFFQAHTFFWGDWHLDSVLGEERGMRISPTRSAIDRGITYTLHQDTPVVPPDMIFTLWTAVNRKTRSGRIIGENQRLSVMEAIKGITINGAYQYFEEDSKGSITAGKRADLVILDRSPLEVDPDEIRDIEVLETIKDGETIFLKG